MSTASAIALGLGGGFALWYATKNRRARSSEVMNQAPAMVSPVTVGTRNARSCGTSSTFTLAVYPEGLAGPTKRVLWFLTDQPVTWDVARDQLVAARVIDPQAIGPNMPGYWRLTTEPHVFDAKRAKTLPDAGETMPRDAARTSARYTREGRTILRDGVAIVYVDRVDLGDARYAISPHEADRLVERVVRLLNAGGTR
ncbi:MAG: hypothetical protein JNL83_00550 [Myxococcales bacterium]|nr:hypothetical protein [Myxococcales bacterium]